VVFHDTELERMTGVSGAVGDQTIETMRGLRLKAGRGGATARATEHGIPTLQEALEATRGRIFVNIDTKFACDLDRIAETVLDMGMCDQVLVKVGVELDRDHSAILDAPWFRKVPFMPIIPARPGRFANDVERIVDTFHPQMIEIMFERLEDVTAARPVLEKNDVRLWTNTLNEVHSLALSDNNALRDPAAVWGVLIAAGIGAVQTDFSAALARFLAGRNPLGV
jgi:glycerophosphoryl diester phosphodiesterase